MSVHWHDDECDWCPCDEADVVLAQMTRAARARGDEAFERQLLDEMALRERRNPST